ncbi:ABC transporter permease subunit [Clostridium sp. SYSU_GA19001]|uniref:ABC transporter permease n=1 Tax=Clostridium caldaquaticum TaxID=2940653 RepID=UPI002076D8F8|nr:ABC transporter permease subunit [Clostridium caldaquaticum]MCM8711524.1 ABC transporter permease subunit [Clostridium caldaquaticum]
MPRRKDLRELPYHLMLLPCVIIVILMNYVPMFGIVMAFQKYVPTKGILGSKFVGLDNFKYIINMPDTLQVLFNTVFISSMKIVLGIIVPVTVALLLNEVRITFLKRSIQTIIYLPHFLSWIVLSGILIDILSPSTGIVNTMLKALGFEPVFFLGNEKVFPYVLALSDTWKEFGFGTIVYLAALTGVDPTLYEAAIVDGASRWKQTLHVTLPSIMYVIILTTVLSLGNVLNAGFDQVFNLYSPAVYKTGDIIDTMVYRLGIVDARFSIATAVGLFKSIVSFIFIAGSYKLAYKYGDYRIF